MSSDKTGQQTPKQLKTPFLENLFIVNHKRGHKFLSVAKVGSTTIKTLTAHDDGHELPEAQGPQDIHWAFGFRHNGKSMVRVDSPLFPHYLRVAVYRDPVERVTSWYKDKLLRMGSDERVNNYYLKLDLIGEKNYQRVVDFLDFEVNKPHGDWIDEHLRPVARYAASDEVDLVVRVEDLDAYLESIGCSVAVVKEGQKNRTRRHKFEFPADIKAKIRQIYTCDLEFIDNSSKIWHPEYKFSPKQTKSS